MPITFNGGTFASYTDTTGNDTTFALAEGRIDNDPSANSPGVGDLFDSTPASPYTYLLTGANVQTISGGTLITNAYGQLIVASDGRYQFVPNAAGINSLPAGQQALNYTVQVTDSTGETASTTFTIQLTGAVDAPTLTGGTLATYNDTAATDVFAVQAGRIDNDPTATTTGIGQLRGDTGSTYTYAITGTNVANSVINGQNVGTEQVGTYGRLVLANDGRYQYVPNSAAINAVPAGSNPVDTFTIRINDSNGTSVSNTFTVQVNGATETAVALTGGSLATYTDTAATGETFALVTGRLDTDPLAASNGTAGSGRLDGGTGNVSYTLTGTGVNNVTVGDTLVGTQLSNEFGRLTLATDGRYQFEPNSTAIDTLPAGARTLNYTVQVTDANGTSATATYTVNLNGATDTQTLAGGRLAAFVDTAAFDTFAVQSGTIDTNPGSATNGVGQLAGDTGTRTYSLTSAQATNILVGGVVVGQEINTFYGRLVLATDGRYQFVPNDTALNSLSTGDNGDVLSFGIQVATVNGTVTSTSTANFTINVTGATDTAPVLTGGILTSYVDNEATDTFAVRQGNFDTDRTSPSNGTTNGGFLDGGTGALTYSIVGSNVTNVVVGGTVVGYQSIGTYGRLTVSTDGRYQFEPNNATIDALPLGVNPMDTFAIRVTDATGASSTANYTVNITGGTDIPTVNQTPATSYFTQVAETDAAIAVSGRVEGVDRAGNTLTYGYNPVNPTTGTTNTFSFVNSSNLPVTLTAAQQTAIAQGFSVNAQTGAYTFNLASPDFLDPGQTLVAGFRVTVTNQFGEATQQFVQVNVTGTIEQGPAGTTGDDRLTGGAFGDLINGGTGDDIIVGGGGNDQLFGGSGDDTLRGGLGFNTIDGGSGNDTGILEGLRSAYTFTRTGTDTFTATNVNGTETHQFISVENFQFSDGTVVTFNQLFPG